MRISEMTFYDTFEIDELYHFISERPRTETRENTYVIPLMSRTPRQIIGFTVDNSNSAKVIQSVVDNAPDAYQYNSDGFFSYMDVVFPWYLFKFSSFFIQSRLSFVGRLSFCRPFPLSCTL